MLIEVVSRGGNLAINVGPQPDGQLPKEALKDLSELGDWLKVNGEAIYGTRAYDVAQIDNVMFTQKGDIAYAMIPLNEEENLGETVFIPTDKKAKSVTCLGFEGALNFEQTEKGIDMFIPCKLVNTNPYAVWFKLKF